MNTGQVKSLVFLKAASRQIKIKVVICYEAGLLNEAIYLYVLRKPYMKPD